MPRLFFRKKNKRKSPRIKDALASLPAFVAVPSSPTPGSPSATQPTRSFDFQQQSPLDSTLTSTIGTQSEWPNEDHHTTREHSLRAVPDLPGSEDESVAGYATVKNVQSDKNDQVLAISRRPRESTPPRSRASLEVDHSLPRERLVSTSELPSVTSGLSFHSDSSDNIIFNPPHSSSSNRPPSHSPIQTRRKPQASAVQNNQVIDEKTTQLYAKVQKPKRNAELPPKAPTSSARYSDSPPQPSASYRERPSHKETVDFTPQSRNEHSRLRERFPPDLHQREEVHTPAYSEEDYLPSDEASESMPSPQVTRKHHRSATYPSHQHHRPPTSSRKGDTNRPSQSPHLSYGHTSPNAMHPSTIPSHQNQTYFFSEEQPDGSMQYYSARPVLSPPPPSLSSSAPHKQAGLVESGYYSNVPNTVLFQPTSPVRPESRVNMPPETRSPGPQNNRERFIPSPRVQETHLQTRNASRSDRVSTGLTRDVGTSPVGKMLDGNASPEKKKFYKEMVGLFEDKEVKLQTQIGQLETTNTNLVEENEALKRLCDTTKDNEVQSTGRLRKQISALQTENNKKDLCINTHKLEMSRLKEEVSMLQEENQHMLQASISDESGWEEVAEHAKSVLVENSSLLKQQEVQREKLWEMKKGHQTAIQQLKMEISKLHKERGAMEQEMTSLGDSHAHLKEELHSLASRAAKQMTVDEHQQAMEEVQSLLEELTDKTESDVRNQETRLRVLQKEKKELVNKVTDSKAVIMRLEEEGTSLQKTNRKLKEKLTELQSELEVSRDREVAAHDQLNKAVAQAERAMTERDTFAKIAKSQQKAHDRTSHHMASNKQTFREMEDRLETYTSQANHKLDRASLLLKEHERQHRSEQRVYEGEIKHLETLLEARQFHCKQLAKGRQMSSTFNGKNST